MAATATTPATPATTNLDPKPTNHRADLDVPLNLLVDRLHHRCSCRRKPDTLAAAARRSPDPSATARASIETPAACRTDRLPCDPAAWDLAWVNPWKRAPPGACWTLQTVDDLFQLGDAFDAATTCFSSSAIRASRGSGGVELTGESSMTRLMYHESAKIANLGALFNYSGS